MKKRLMALLVCVLLLVMVIPSVANAQGNDPSPVKSFTISSARYSGAEFKALERMVATANRQIEIAVAPFKLSDPSGAAAASSL